VALASKQRCKRAITNAGGLTPLAGCHKIRISLTYRRVGNWVTTRELTIDGRFPDRRGVFAEMARAVGDQPLLYLEFSVHEGTSLREWSLLPGTRLLNFNSFRGLPNGFDVRNGRIKGSFDLDGGPPRSIPNGCRFMLSSAWADH
jgi:hypothetical protein